MGLAFCHGSHFRSLRLTGAIGYMWRGIIVFQTVRIPGHLFGRGKGFRLRYERNPLTVTAMSVMRSSALGDTPQKPLAFPVMLVFHPLVPT